jgi:hypothetical protein
MSTTISGTSGVSQVQDAIVTPVKTQVGALPSMVRLYGATTYGSSGTKILRFSTVATNQGSDITYNEAASPGSSAVDGAKFTINTNGVYAISFSANFNPSDWLGISLNTSSPSTPLTSLPAGEALALGYTGSVSGSGLCVSTTVYLAAGSVIRPHTNTPGTISSGSYCVFTITRVA